MVRYEWHTIIHVGNSRLSTTTPNSALPLSMGQVLSVFRQTPKQLRERRKLPAVQTAGAFVKTKLRGKQSTGGKSPDWQRWGETSRELLARVRPTLLAAAATDG